MTPVNDDLSELSELPLIPHYFKGKSVLITGGTGYIGKIMIEKLLYSCSELQTIYLLMRAKKGVKSKDRLSPFYRDSCFDRLRNERPGLFEAKIKIITGDIEQSTLGISVEDKALLIKTTNIVFHIAASVRFNDHLSKAITINLLGTKLMLDLAYEFEKLESFIHVSTAFSNTRRDCIDEVLYPPLGDWRDTIEICKSLDKQILHVFTKKYIEDMENTYVFTKHLAEHMVYEHHGKLPVVIYRPSIVSPCLREPIVGWVDNFNGPIGILAACGKGLLRTVYCKKDVVLDMIPVCSVVRGAIVAAWERGTKKLEATDEVPIYNACDGGLNKVTIQDLSKLGKSITKKIPLGLMIWTCGGVCNSNSVIFHARFYLLQLLPAIIIDGLLKLFGKRTMLMKIQRRIYMAMLAVSSFNCYNWRFSVKKFMDLASKLKAEDRKEFDFTYSFEPYEYFSNCVVGARKYLMKEKDEDIPKHRALHDRFMILDRLLKCLIYGYILWWILRMLITQFDV